LEKQLADNEEKSREFDDAKQNEIQQLIEKITIIEKIVENEKEKSKDLEKQLTDNEIKAREADVAKQNEIDALNRELSNQIEESKSKTQEYEKKITEAKDEISSLEKQLVENEVKAKKDNDSKQNEIKQLLEKITLIEKIVEDEKVKSNELEEKLNNNIEKSRVVENDKQSIIDDLTRQLDDAKNKVQNYEEIIKNAKDKISSMEKQMADNENNLEEIKNSQIEDANEKVKIYEKMVNDAEDKISSLEKQITDNEARAKENNDSKQDEIKQLLEKISIVEKKLEDEMAKSKNLEKQLADNEEISKSIEDEKQKEIEEKSEVIKEPSSEESVEEEPRQICLPEDLEDKQKEINKLMAKIAEMEKIANQEKERADSLGKQLADNKEKSKDLVSQLEKEKERADLLEKKLNEKKENPVESVSEVEVSQKLSEIPDEKLVEEVSEVPEEKLVEKDSQELSEVPQEEYNEEVSTHSESSRENPWKQLIPTFIELIVNQVKNKEDQDKQNDMKERNHKNYYLNLSNDGRIYIMNGNKNVYWNSLPIKLSEPKNVEASLKEQGAPEQNKDIEPKLGEISKIARVNSMGYPDETNEEIYEITEGSISNEIKNGDREPVEESYMIVREDVNDDTNVNNTAIEDDKKKHVTFDENPKYVNQSQEKKIPVNYYLNVGDDGKLTIGDDNDNIMNYWPLRLNNTNEKETDTKISESKEDDLLTEEYYEITEETIPSDNESDNDKYEVSNTTEISTSEPYIPKNEDYVIYIEDVVEDPTLDELLDQMEESKRSDTFDEPSEEIIRIDDIQEPKPEKEVEEKKLTTNDYCLNISNDGRLYLDGLNLYWPLRLADTNVDKPKQKEEILVKVSEPEK